MFNEITAGMQERMRELEAIDREDRVNPGSRTIRMLQIPPETGRFLALLAANTPDGDMIELGTSAGYSAMWLSLAAKEKKCKIKTFEIMPEKIALAKETFKQSGIDRQVQIVEGNAVENLKQLGEFGFCFMDFDKELYDPAWDILRKKVLPNGLITADNCTSHKDVLKPWITRVLSDPEFDSQLVPIGSGIMVCRRKQ